jgi:hypothetical protein
MKVHVKLSDHAVDRFAARDERARGKSPDEARALLQSQLGGGSYSHVAPGYVTEPRDSKSQGYLELDGDRCLSLVSDGGQQADGTPVYWARTFLTRWSCDPPAPPRFTPRFV